MIQPNERSCLCIILAAGEGTRMRSTMPKVLHPIGGVPMISHVVMAALGSGCSDLAIVVGNQAERVKSQVLAITDRASFYEQTERKGTGHAVLSAREAIAKGYDEVMVLFGDVPLTKPQTLRAMRQDLAKDVDLCVLGFTAEDPGGYGRVIRENGHVVAIREHKDATDEEREITLCNGGIMIFDGKDALEHLDAITNDNAQGEYYLPDMVEISNRAGKRVQVTIADEIEIMGINNRAELSKANSIWQWRKRHQLLLYGVSMEAPETVFFHHDTVVEPDVTIEPNVVFGPKCVVRSGAEIRAFSHLEGAIVESNAIVGPYARLRPGAILGPNSKVGNFCEVKNADIGDGAKVNHLSYVGDAVVGAKANIGAGTITCNYDGMNKHKTHIGAGAFIGSNSALVAPVSIGNGAYVASGSVITSEVPDNAMGIGRGFQKNKDGYADDIRKRNEQIKKSR